MRQHENCNICEEHPQFDLDSKVYVHGEYITKEQILKNEEDVEQLERVNSLFAELEIPPPYDLWLAESLQIRERLKKRIEELKILLANPKLTKEESMELQYWLRENTMARGEEK